MRNSFLCHLAQKTMEAIVIALMCQLRFLYRRCTLILVRKFEDAKVVIRSCKSKMDRQYNVQKKKDKGQNMIYKTLLRKN